MDDERLVITETGFLTEFLNQHSQRTDRPFCFILGAGVSRSSGILTGGELAQIWLRELYEAENFAGLSLEDWATPERLDIPGFAIAKLARFYPQLYERRYGDYEQAGYAFLESQMEGREPSYGFSVLAYLLSETPHRVVVTTNFDNLVADGLSIHSSRFPLVIGHDALTRYAAVELRRPLVAKIHGALGFSPKSQPGEISVLPEGWQTALERILDRYTPIVIGYEGNDGSLMSFLKSLPAQIPDRVLWCVYAPGSRAGDCLNLVSSDIRNYVRSKHGRFIPIQGFDELMAKLLSKLREKGSVPDLYERLQERARQRERSYDDQQRKLFEAAVPAQSDETEGTSLTPSVDSSLSEAVSEIAESRKDKPWWLWFKEASAAPNDDTTEAIWLQALKALPDNPQVLRSYALFLDRNRRDFDRAEGFYKRAVKAGPEDPLTLAFYGNFLDLIRKSPDQAEAYFRRGLEASPDDSYILTRYANFLQSARNDMDKAEEFYRRAFELNPRYDYLLKNYAAFLRTVRGNSQKAEELEQLAQAGEKA